MQRPLILIVDDERPITSVMRRKLEQNGFDVIEAHDGEEALQLAHEHGPDLVITDLQMPGISGLELAVALARTGPAASVPLIMLTGRGHYVAEDVLMRTNIKHLLAKPFSARQVLECVQQILGIDPHAREAA